MILTLAGMLVSVVSAAAIVRQKLATVIDQLADTEVRFAAWIDASMRWIPARKNRSSD